MSLAKQGTGGSDADSKEHKATPPPYPKRHTVPDTGHGPNYQIQQSMDWAFYYAYEVSEAKDQSFQLHTEDTTYGDFDDLVVITDKGIEAFQYKHRKEEGAETLGDFWLKVVMAKS